MDVSNRVTRVSPPKWASALWTRLTSLCLVAVIALGFSRCSSLRHGADIPLTTLSGTPNGLDPLKNAFNQNVGKVRLMLLLDPT